MKSRKHIIRAHLLFGIGAITLILFFQVATILSELFSNVEGIALWKERILFTIPALVICMIGAGASGSKLAGKSQHPLVLKKKKRMKWIALNGLFILVPSAIALYLMSRDLLITGNFYVVQSIELIAGGANFVLLALNIRDGFRIRKPIHTKATL